jgi:hypothetical protein
MANLNLTESLSPVYDGNWSSDSQTNFAATVSGFVVAASTVSGIHLSGTFGATQGIYEVWTNEPFLALNGVSTGASASEGTLQSQKTGIAMSGLGPFRANAPHVFTAQPGKEWLAIRALEAVVMEVRIRMVGRKL